MFIHKVQRTRDGGKTHYYSKHFVIPCFRGLRLPISGNGFWRGLKAGHLGILDSKTGDEYIYLLWGQDALEGRWVSMYYECGMHSLKEARECYAQFKQALEDHHKANIKQKADEFREMKKEIKDLKARITEGQTIDPLAAGLNNTRHHAAQQRIRALESENEMLRKRLNNNA